MTFRKHTIIIALVAVGVAVGIMVMRSIVAKERGVDYLSEAAKALAVSRSADVHVVIDTEVDAAALVGAAAGTEGPVYVPMSLDGTMVLSYPADAPLTGSGTWGVTDPSGPSAKHLLSAETVLDETGRLFMRMKGLSAPETGKTTVDVTRLNDVWFTVGPDMLLPLVSWSDAAGDAEAVIAPRHAGRLRDAMTARSPFIRTGRMEDTSIDGHAVAHYMLRSDPEAISDTLVALGELVGGRTLSAKEQAAIRMQARDRAYLVDVLIDMRTRRFSLIHAIVVPGEAEEDVRPFAITIKFDGFDVPVTAQAPEGAQPLKTLLSTMFPAGSR